MLLQIEDLRKPTSIDIFNAFVPSVIPKRIHPIKYENDFNIGFEENVYVFTLRDYMKLH